jgi:hypothetical protein
MLKATHLCRRRGTSFACNGANCCLTVVAIFFMLFHFSGSSCKGDLNVVTQCSLFSHMPRLDITQLLSSML